MVPCLERGSYKFYKCYAGNSDSYARRNERNHSEITRGWFNRKSGFEKGKGIFIDSLVDSRAKSD